MLLTEDPSVGLTNTGYAKEAIGLFAGSSKLLLRRIAASLTRSVDNDLCGLENCWFSA